VIVKVLKGTKEHAVNLNRHLLNEQDNEEVRVNSFEGITSVMDLVKIDEENKKLSKRRAKYSFLHIVVNPRWNLTEEEWEKVWGEIESEFGLGLNSWVEFIHSKKGKTHIHRVYTYTDAQGKNVDNSFLVKRSLKVASKLTDEIEKIDFDFDSSRRLRWDRLTPKEVEIAKRKGESIEEYLRHKAQESIRKGYTTSEFEIKLTLDFVRGEKTLEEIRREYQSYLTRNREGVDDELREIKEYSLVDLLEREGWVEKKEKRGHKYRTYRLGGEVIVVNTYTNRYFKPEEARRTYTTVDFIQDYILHEENLGKVKKWFKENILTSYGPQKMVQREERRSDEIFRRKYKELKRATFSRFLSSRGLQVRLSDYSIYYDSHKNFVVKHYALDNKQRKLVPVGLELRNYKFKQNVGRKSIGILNPDKLSSEVVIVAESFIDALSYAQLNRYDDALLLSTSGRISEEGLRTLIGLSLGKKVILAFDNDEAGMEMAEQIRNKLTEFGIDVVEDIPVFAKDWNEVLQEQSKFDIEIDDTPQRGSYGPRMGP